MEKDKHLHDFEQYMRRQLEGLDAQAEEDTWAKIAAEQRKRNTRLVVRYRAPYILGMTGVLALLLFAWYWLSPSGNGVLPYGPYDADTAYNGFFPFDTAWTPLINKAPERNGLHPHPKVVRAAWFYTNTVPMHQLRFEADRGLRYRNPSSGNTVEIPPSALVYADGAPVTGPVDFSFREYRSLADFLAAGMPMHYTDARGSFYFNSAGMFEVRVSQDGADLYMAPGKKYNVGFTPTAPLRDANMFYLSDTTNQWSHLHGQLLADTIGFGDLNSPRILTDAEVALDNALTKPNACIPGLSEVKSEENAAEWMRDGILTGRAYARGAMQPPMWFRKNTDKSEGFFLKALERSDIRIVHQKDTKERFFPDDMNGTFSELSAFKACFFVRTADSSDQLAPKNKNSVDYIFRQKRMWRRVEVVPLNGALCEVIFSDEKEEIHVPSRLARSSEAGGGTVFDPNQIFAEYKRLRSIRHANYMETLQRWRRFLRTATMFQTPEEWCMDGQEWLSYFEDNRNMMLARYEALYDEGLVNDPSMAHNRFETWQQRLKQLQFDRVDQSSGLRSNAQNMAMSLKLSGFGTYNCDQIFKISKQAAQITAQYKTENGKSIVPVAVRIIDRATRLFFFLPNNTSLLNLPGRQLDVIVQGNDGRTYLLPGKVYANSKIENGSIYTFPVEDVTERVGTPSEWAALLGI